jgi:carboxypeptidase family protein
MWTAHGVAFVLTGLAAFGQMNTGEISGSIQDATNSLLPGATIVAEQLGTGQRFTAASNSSGEYLFASMPVGVYSLTVSAKNFKQSALPRLDARQRSAETELHPTGGRFKGPGYGDCGT